MGITHVMLTISNPENGKTEITDKFLVDSGASITVLPENIVRKLNIKPKYNKEFILADGKVVKRSIGSANIKFNDIEMPTPVVLGKKNDSKLLGALTLEGMGLSLDPFERKLYKARLTL